MELTLEHCRGERCRQYIGEENVACQCQCRVCKKIAAQGFRGRKAYGLSGKDLKLLTARLMEALDLVQMEKSATIVIGSTTYTVTNIDQINRIYKRLYNKFLWSNSNERTKFVIPLRITTKPED